MINPRITMVMSKIQSRVPLCISDHSKFSGRRESGARVSLDQRQVCYRDFGLLELPEAGEEPVNIRTDVVWRQFVEDLVKEV